MPISLFMRRRAPDTSKEVDKALLAATPQKAPREDGGSSFQNATFFFICLLVIWCSSMLFSGTFFHVCISSRKLNVYCIAGGTGRDLGVLDTPKPFGFPTLNTVSSAEEETNGAKGSDSDQTDVDDEKARAVKVVEEQMRTIRSWAVTNTSAGHLECKDRGVFVYDLPTKFNLDLMVPCADLVPWADMCEYFGNEAMGQPIRELGEGWYRTHQYSLEHIFHSRILRHRCRVYDPAQAKLFYVPYYGGLDVLRWHFKNVSNDVKDAMGLELLRWLENQESWKRNRGKDHMFVLGKISWDFRRIGSGKLNWGSTFLDLEQMKLPYKFLIERQPWEINDIGIPHPTHFHPHTDADIAAWQAKAMSSNRKNLIGFAGAARPGSADNIRSILINQCQISSADGTCKFLNCSSGGCDNSETVIQLFVESEFCLQPPGDSPTRKSVFDSLVAGCIPVLFDPFTAYYQYPWHLPSDHEKYSVFVDQEEVRKGKVDVVEKLRKVTVDEKEAMRRHIVYEIMPGILYGDPTAEFETFRDAFQIVMDGVLDAVSRSNG